MSIGGLERAAAWGVVLVGLASSCSKEGSRPEASPASGFTRIRTTGRREATKVATRRQKRRTAAPSCRRARLESSEKTMVDRGLTRLSSDQH